MKPVFTIVLFLFFFELSAQQASGSFETYPVFPECEEVSNTALADCFTRTLQTFVFANFQPPEKVVRDSYTGEVVVFFEVTRKGEFEVLYVDAIYEELKAETHRVFEALPKVKPATYSARPTYMQFTLPIKFPLERNISTGRKVTPSKSLLREETKSEYDAIENLGYTNEKYSSNLNMPLSHQDYARVDYYMNQVGNNAHTAQKPYTYGEVNHYFDFAARDSLLFKDKSSWFGRKFWNEHMVAFKGKGYWFTIDPGVDLQIGKDFDQDVNTYNNTRLAYVQGGLGKKLHFSAAVYESQGRFADYYNRYAESIAADFGGNPAIIPGFGIAKDFNGNAYDYPMATGYLSYNPDSMFNVQLGHGKNTIGDGYRSLFMSDVASPHPFLKLNTNFWKLKYTNTWMSLRDVREEATVDGAFTTKYMATHYLSYNISKRLNIGLFESVLWDNSNDRGIDVNYLNPVIFYRAIEFSTGPRSGNALVGLSAKYKFSDQINLYGQWIIDEFSTSDIFGGEKSWKNKLGYQVGIKYYRPFGLQDFYLQAEYNQVRPYTYSHNTITLNYGHNNQSMAHLWGANFKEFVGIVRFEKNRFFASGKVVLGERGFDFNTEDDTFNYGGDIYRNEEDRPYDSNITIGQGNKARIFHGELQAGYLLNPSSNLKMYTSLIYRDFTPDATTNSEFQNTTTWLNFGIRTDLFNWYNDF